MKVNKVKPRVRELREEEVVFDCECEPEEMQIEGNASAIGPEEDAQTYKWIRDQLDGGNEWAWCGVIVTARWGDFEAKEYLGGCSYESREDFMKPGGYYDDMKSEALAALNVKIRASFETLSTLIK